MKLKYTGERVIPDSMKSDPINLSLHLHRYIFALPYIVNKNCLDVACGTGYGMQIMSSMAKSITGMDYDEVTIQWAKHNNLFYNTQIKFINIDLNNSIIKGEYDVVVSYETIEHLNSPQDFLKQIKHVLTRDGLLILSTPINEPPNPFHKHFFNWKSVMKTVENIFGKNIKWYSQYINSIEDGINADALFAICIVYKNDTVFFKYSKKIKGFLKIKKINLLKFIGKIPRSRW